MKIYKKIYILNNIKNLDSSTISLFDKFTSNKEIENELIYENLKDYVKCLINIEENANKKIEYIFQIENFNDLDEIILNKIDKIINNPKLQNNFKELLKYIKDTDKEYVLFKEEVIDE